VPKKRGLLAPVREMVASIGNVIAVFRNKSNMLLSYASFTKIDVFLIFRWTYPLLTPATPMV
jgi:hypothetical protein